jgi:hypothetical protein
MEKWKFVWFIISMVNLLLGIVFFVLGSYTSAIFGGLFAIMFALFGIGATLQEILEHLKD